MAESKQKDSAGAAPGIHVIARRGKVAGRQQVWVMARVAESLVPDEPRGCTLSTVCVTRAPSVLPKSQGKAASQPR